jgi:SH3-like domain-containing protein
LSKKKAIVNGRTIPSTRFAIRIVEIAPIVTLAILWEVSVNGMIASAHARTAQVRQQWMPNGRGFFSSKVLVSIGVSIAAGIGTTSALALPALVSLKTSKAGMRCGRQATNAIMAPSISRIVKSIAKL